MCWVCEQIAMQFKLSDEQQQFSDALRKWAERAYPFEHRQQLVRGGQGSRAEDWNALVELGLPALGVPEEQGGLGAGGIDHLVAMQEAGRMLLAEPLFTTLWGSAFLRASGNQAALLERVAAGELRLACAVSEAAGRHDADWVEAQAHRNATGWCLSGHKATVLHGGQADLLIVSARTAGAGAESEGITLFAVDAKAPGLKITDSATFDGLRASSVQLDNVQVLAGAVLGNVGQGWEILDGANDFGAALLCAEALGIMEVMRDDTLEHLRTRRQFGQPIGKFQALQHRMAEVALQLEQARSMAWLAMTQVNTDNAVDRRRCVSAAKAHIGQALRFVGQQCVQLNGGLGVSDEMRLTHFFRRAVAIELSLGDTDHHVARFQAQPNFLTA
ncbi:alkylation response protein AidB-like acyl-CoA dehydrogenase [Ottowia thiooxydans]|uniref:Alkylation response protein AidB-like acyl-CoA dehydrogenase n=2 Tax=Ottowia thiooxydans TaxID=219182 RepID=A0ABV2QHC0_9BURK